MSTVTTEPVAPIAETESERDALSTTERLAQSAHEVIDDAAEKASKVEHQVRESAERANEKLEGSRQAAGEQLDRTIASAENFINERPVAAAGIAFAAGVLATALLRR
jgi:ElaB/YqjD/DUF883 family membrane-anchored ribosome-binding protein